jgi:hypothetical protein
MTTLVTSLGRFQTTGNTVSIASPVATLTRDVSSKEQCSEGHFSVDLTPIEAPGLPDHLKPSDAAALPRPQCNPEDYVYGEDGERLPYHPARLRQPNSGGLARQPLGPCGGLDQFAERPS